MLAFPGKWPARKWLTLRLSCWVKKFVIHEWQGAASKVTYLLDVEARAALIQASHDHPGRRRWDNPLGPMVDAGISGFHLLWAQVAQDREDWKRLEPLFVQRALRLTATSAVPAGRFMAGPTP